MNDAIDFFKIAPHVVEQNIQSQSSFKSISSLGIGDQKRLNSKFSEKVIDPSEKRALSLRKYNSKNIGLMDNLQSPWECLPQTHSNFYNKLVQVSTG